MRRTPSERYRVYSADEFLAALTLDRDGEPARRADVSGARARSGAAGPSARRRGRFAGATLLLGAIGSVGTLTAASVLGGHRQIGHGRRAAARRSTTASASSQSWRRVRSIVEPPPDVRTRRDVRRPFADEMRSRPRAPIASRPRARRSHAPGVVRLAAVRSPDGKPTRTPVVAGGREGEFGFER